MRAVDRQKTKRYENRDRFSAALRLFRFMIAPAVLLMAATVPLAAQQSDAEKILIQKAQALEQRGRPDIAVQVWQQILLSDPNNAMALEGVARDYRLSGNSAASDEALDKLRKINPSDPNISRIQGLTSDKRRDARLAQAGALAKAGNPEAAMRIYREYYGDHPPDGDIALAYYETLYATPNGKEEALRAMRAAAARNPGDPRFIVTLGRMLTYDTKTRAEGIKILREHQDNSDAQMALRQALVWDSANPASAAELKEYLRTHPADAQMQERLKVNEGKLAEMNAGIARTPAERAAFGALNAHHLQEAETRFQAMLDANEKDARAAAGMGFVRMQQNNFGAAISYLEQAEENGFRDSSIVNGLATSRFWYTMGQASAAFDANQSEVAEEKYKAALVMRPHSLEALNGLAGVYTKNQQYSQAIAIYQQLLKSQPRATDAWRGLFLSYARAGQNQQALSLMARFPASVKAAVNRDPDYLQTLATIYQAQGRDADAQRVLAQALALPFPDNGANLKNGTRLQYASILMAAKRYSQAAEMYQQVLNEDTSSLPAWMGLVTAEHQLEHDNEAIGLVEKMPPDTYDSALSDPGFLTMLGSIYQQSNQFEIAQGLLERAVRLETQSGGQPPLNLQIQLAAIYLQRNNTAQAYGIYKQILQTHPDNLPAWRGLIGALQQTNRNTEALEEIKLIPPDVRKQLETDVQFEQTEASLYASAGDTVNAMALFNNVQKHYTTLREEPPADVQIQSAYLLYNTKNDSALYPALMQLGARQDLTVAQRETIQSLWANWSVRRASQAFDNGNTARATDILDAAAQAFPDNLTVRKAVAGGYLQVGKSREALAIFKQIDMQNGSAADFQGAIGAALAANDKGQAETWLRQALDRYPRDSGILALAARFEQARGDNARAADYWRASLAAMPQVSPQDKLAHELVNPEPMKPNQRPATPADLANLLNPDRDASAANGRSGRALPPLPAYGHDPYQPSAPVVIAPQTTPGIGSTPSIGQYQIPTTTTTPLPQSDLQTAPQGGSEGSSLPALRLPSGTRSSAAATTMQPQASDTGSRNGDQGRVRKKTSTANEGRMQLPESGRQGGLGTTPSQAQQGYPQIVPQSYQPSTAQQSKVTNPPDVSLGSSLNLSGLRLSTQPMNLLAARTQALMTAETDAQLTEGLTAGTIHYLPNAGVSGAASAYPSSNAASATQQSQLPANSRYSEVQYTPSAQDAAAGAYSAPKQATTKPQQTELPIPPPQTTTGQQATTPAPKLERSKRRRRSKPAAQGNSVPTLVTAPGDQQQPTTQLPVTEGIPSEGQATPSTTGLSDQELEERNLPPLKGPWVRLTHPKPKVLSPREEAEMQLRTIEGGYSAWLGGTGTIAHRTGDPGFNSLTSLSADFEYSLPIGTTARLTFIARPAFLDSGQADGNAVIQLTTNGVTTTSPEPIGTMTGTLASTTPPAQQNSAGIGGEAQLTFGNLAIAGGYTPYGFLVSNWTGRASWRPGNGPFTFSFNRDSVKDTQLSFGGLRDPATITAFNAGNVWGGVIANSANVQYGKGDLNSGFYVGVGGQYITGLHVQENRRFDGSMGAYWRVLAMPEYGTLNVGANFFGMHYTYNLSGYTWGMGGYFSPQSYFLANVPITWSGHYLTRWHYTVLGSFGIQAFSQDAEPLAPLDLGIETNTFNNAKLAALTSVGANYDLRGQTAYAIGDHWFVGGFASANNSRNYTNLTAGFSVRYLFRSQPSTVAGPTGLFQTDDAHAMRPLTVP
ncbi:cellulose synthase subunit BcsC-related outer membrane protein [Acidicapsa dinghuensis]|uniref:Cellulose synthase subunit BcsC-related outer membrane protein n=1 Tax=Acidicapsa dinghuensis TaxID=2218256 RepID=A0ABW1ELV9_9BACT|nr:cellulose synthase subunit BcsC-related outer membrane protein [Acidicapsa dinghuensis]